MSTKVDAEILLRRLQATEALLWRMGQNRAYEGHAEEILIWLDCVGALRATIYAQTKTIEGLALVDPLGTRRSREWEDCAIAVSHGQTIFAREIVAPLAELIGATEGAAAKARWLPWFASKSERPAPAVSSALAVRERRAVIVGVGDYTRVGRPFGPLSTCAADARALAELLAADRRYPRGGAHTAALIDTDARHAPVLAAVESAAGAAGDDDMLLFYFSGHGDLLDGEAVLIPYDYDTAEPGPSALRVGEINRLMGASRARQRVIILDSCHSGPDIAVGPAKGPAPERPMSAEYEQRVFAQARGGAVLSACVRQQQSYTYRDTGLSAFTYFFCQGLRGAADEGRKGFITVSDAFHYVVDEVSRWAADHGLRQTPALEYTTTGELVLMDYRGEQAP